MFSIFSVLLVSVLVSPVLPARILMLTVIGTTSTTGSFQALADELVKQGHEVVFVCHTKVVEGPQSNITYMQLPFQFDNEIVKQFFDSDYMNWLFLISNWFIIDVFIDLCRMNLNSNEALLLRDYDKEIDLVISDMYMQECFLPLLHAKHAPIVMYHGNAIETVNSYLSQVPTPYAYVGSFGFQPPLPMTFFNRMWNTAMQLSVLLSYRWKLYPAIEQLNHKLLTHVPRIEDIMLNVSSLMGNIDAVWNSARPSMPFTVDITCSHCRRGKELPNNIQSSIDEAKDGFILFSMGTFFKSEYFPENYLKIFMAVFSKLTNHVILWKRDPFEDQPANVKTFKWLPQQDLLAHPKLKLFISHGGLYSTQEAIFHRVPILGIGIFGDQEDNLRELEKRGCALSIDRRNITVENLYESIINMLTDSRYRNHIKQWSALMQDQPETAMERAVHAIEFLLRHKNDPLVLKGDNLHLNFIEYFSLDVLAVLSVPIIAVTIIAICIGSKLISRILK